MIASVERGTAAGSTSIRSTITSVASQKTDSFGDELREALTDSRSTRTHSNSGLLISTDENSQENATDAADRQYSASTASSPVKAGDSDGKRNSGSLTDPFLGLKGEVGATLTLGGKTYKGNGAGGWDEVAGAPAAGERDSDLDAGDPIRNFRGKSPWAPEARIAQLDEQGRPTGEFTYGATARNPNINYVTREAAENLANQFGANLIQLAPTGSPFGEWSAPVYLLDFGRGNPIGAGQIQAWLQRGDPIGGPCGILARIEAGIAGQPGMPASLSAAQLNAQQSGLGLLFQAVRGGPLNVTSGSVASTEAS